MTKNKRILIYILFGIGVVAGTTAPFFHRLFDKTIYETSAQGIALEKKLSNNEISLEAYKVAKTSIKKSFRYKGFSNKRRFVLAMDDHIAMFIWGLVILGISRLIPPVFEGVKIKLIATIAGCTMIFSSSYFIHNNFWWHMTSSDYPDWVYTIGFSIMAISTAVLSLLLVDGFFTRIRKLKKSFLDFLSEIRNVYYKNLLRIGMEKDLYDETYQEALKNESKQFSRKVYEKAKELVD